METRTDKIRRLQDLIRTAEARKAILEKKGLYTAAEQVILDRRKEELEYEQKMELEEVNKPVIIQPEKKSWQDNIILYIVVLIIAAVAAAFLVKSC